jgi:hypothetical protein
MAGVSRRPGRIGRSRWYYCGPIREPGTQLTLRTFHTGGVFTGGTAEHVRAPCNGKIQFHEDLIWFIPHVRLVHNSQVPTRFLIEFLVCSAVKAGIYLLPPRMRPLALGIDPILGCEGLGGESNVSTSVSVAKNPSWVSKLGFP